MMVNIIQTHDSQTQTNEVSKAFSLLTVILSFQHQFFQYYSPSSSSHWIIFVPDYMCGQRKDLGFMDHLEAKKEKTQN